MTPDRSHEPDAPSADEAQAAAGPSRLARLLGWTKAHRSAALVLAGASLLSIAGVATLCLVLALRPARSQAPPSLAEVFEALDAGDYSAIHDMIAKYQAGTALDASGNADFLRGAATAYLAMRTSSVDRAWYFTLAARFLDDSQSKGFPRGREAEGTYLLARSLYESKQYTLGRPWLREALRLNPSRAAELHMALADTYLYDPNPRLTEAETENQAARQPQDVSDAIRWRILMQQAKLFLARGKLPEVEEALSKLPAAAAMDAEKLILRGRVRLEEARRLAADKKDAASPARARPIYEQALQMFRQARRGDPANLEVLRQAAYLTGVCLADSGQRTAAIHQFRRTRSEYPNSPEAQASSFQEAELLRQEGETDEAVMAYHRVLNSVTDPTAYSNPWLSLVELQNRILSVYQEYQQKGDYRAAFDVCRHMSGLFPFERGQELLAEVHHAWGQNLTAQAERQTPSQAEATRAEARRQFRQQAAEHYVLARKLFATRRYPDELWAAVQAYLRGHDFKHAILALREYLQHEPHIRHAEALAALGQAYVAEARLPEALNALMTCVSQHPREIVAFRARILAAKIHAERGELDPAVGLLRDNLDADVLTPASTEWRDSLFELGHVLFLKERYEEAVARMEEAVTRYPAAPQTLATQYLIADAYRRYGYAIQQSLSGVLVENTRNLRTKQRGDALRAAVEQMRKVREALQRRQEMTELAESESRILRNCAFGIPDVLFELGQYDEAIKAYQSAANRYQHAPESLEAYAQIAQAYRRLNQPAEAKLAVEQARMILNRLNPNTSFTETTNRTRQQWVEYFDRLALM